MTVTLTPPLLDAAHRASSDPNPDVRVAADALLLEHHHGERAPVVALQLVAESATELLDHLWLDTADLDGLVILDDPVGWRQVLDELAQRLATADRVVNRTLHPATPVAV